LDPTIPENLERIKGYFKLYNDWGYEIVKFDFTSFDIFGKWGFEMLKEGSVGVPFFRSIRKYSFCI
jgi:alpha-galactosidase